MDNTAALRRIKPTIEACQKGEVALAGKEYAKAEERFRTALKATPRDYAANLLMAKCLAVQDKGAQALEYAADGDDGSIRRKHRRTSWSACFTWPRASRRRPTSISASTTACCLAMPASPSSRGFRSKAWAQEDLKLPAAARTALLVPSAATPLPSVL
jgi:hypothetical protein